MEESDLRLITIRRRSEFRRLLTEGRRVNPTKWLSLSYIENQLPNSRWGWTIPKQAGGATVRNRLKRWGREIVRSRIRDSKLEGVDINVYVRPIKKDHYKRMPYEEFKQALTKGIDTVAIHRKKISRAGSKAGTSDVG